MQFQFVALRRVARALVISAVALGALAACGEKPVTYVFTPGREDVTVGTESLLDVRLTREGSSDPVADAVIFDARFDMEPDGMAAMDAPVKADGSPAPGTYRFIVKPTMAGRWALKLGAKLQGQSDTVHGQVIVTAR